jgi:hypothetical protein
MHGRESVAAWHVKGSVADCSPLKKKNSLITFASGIPACDEEKRSDAIRINNGNRTPVLILAKRQGAKHTIVTQMYSI